MEMGKRLLYLLLDLIYPKSHTYLYQKKNRTHTHHQVNIELETPASNFEKLPTIG